MSSSLAEKLARLARPRGRYLRPDPTRPLEIGAYGRVAGGVLHKVGRVDCWMQSVGIRGFELLRDECNITPGSTRPSPELGLERQTGLVFHVPGLRFECIRDSWKLGEMLVERAKRDRHDPQFWEEDFCVVTGVCFYEVPSMQRAQGAGARVESRPSTDPKCVAFFELHKVHTDPLGNKSWRSVCELRG